MVIIIILLIGVLSILGKELELAHNEGFKCGEQRAFSNNVHMRLLVSQIFEKVKPT